MAAKSTKVTDIRQNRRVPVETGEHMTHRRILVLLFLGCVVLNLAVDGVLGWRLHQSRVQYEKSARTNVTNLSSVLEQNVFTLIKEIDLTLRTVADETVRVGAVSRPNSRAFKEFLQKQADRIPDILGLRVADQAGTIIYATGETTLPHVNFSDRDHFRRLKNDPAADLVVSGPVAGRISNKMLLVFARRISNPDGSFGGEVIASVAIDTINRMFSTIDMGPHGVVSMWDKTTTLARFPESVGGKSAIGMQKPSARLKALLDAETSAALYTATAPTDNVKKSYSIRRVGQFPLWVIAGMAESDYLAQWKSEAWQTILAALLFGVITAFVAWQIYRYWRVGKLIRESENQLNTAQKLAHIGSWTKELDSDNAVWSDEVFRILGLQPQSLVPADDLLLAAVHPDDRKQAEEFLAAVPGLSESRMAQFRIVRPDGTVRWVLVEGGSVHPGRNGRGELTGFIRDITERKHTEEKMQQSEQFTRNILDSVDQGFIVVDRAYRIQIANRAYCGQLPVPCRDIIGKHCYEVAHGSDQPCFEEGTTCAVREVFGDGKPHSAVHRHAGPDGMLYVETKAFPLLDRSGRVTSVIEVISNITERRLLEEERLKSQKLEAVGTLAGGIAHDFNNLLQAVFGYICLAKMRKEEPERSMAALDEAEKALHMSVKLTNQLLTFSKGGKPVTKTLDLLPVIENAAKFALSGSRTGCRVKADDGLWNIEADECQISQVVQNIVLNADQAMPEGGQVNIEARNLSALDDRLPPALRAKAHVLVTISDSGAGISEEHLAKIFDPYFTTKAKGSGLGLATAYSIIRNHNGMIEVKSREGVGTTFTLYLPAASVASREVQVKSAPGVPGRGGRVLVMDDEAYIRDVAGELIMTLGHSVDFATSGKDAIEKFEEARRSGRPFDVVILDLTIRDGMGGAETLQRLLQLEPSVKAVVSSGYSDDEFISNYRQKGFKAVLNKPYTDEELQDVLNRVLTS